MTESPEPYMRPMSLQKNPIKERFREPRKSDRVECATIAFSGAARFKWYLKITPITPKTALKDFFY